MITQRHVQDDNPNRPHINGRIILCRTQQQLGSSVKEGNYFRRHRDNVHGRNEGARDAKVSNFDIQVGVEQYVVRLKVSMYDTMAMTIIQASQQLMCYSLGKAINNRNKTSK